ncbi:MAG: LysM peptidoglycan-binding domain-containing protein [Thiothrix sp.]|nr:LysM peptidoglycan-binding domain-containing protein [Thiothrix sp.]HPE61651.1 LysM peptidoglycan-binding domain-containing protein [Thiolinea sp.]
MKLNKVAMATLLSCGLLVSGGSVLAHGNGGGASASIGVISSTGYIASPNGNHRGNAGHHYNRNDRRHYNRNTRDNRYHRAPVQVVRYVYVQRGDTLGRIAARHRVGLKRLQQLNNLYGHRANSIWVGMRLRIN